MVTGVCGRPQVSGVALGAFGLDSRGTPQRGLPELRPPRCLHSHVCPDSLHVTRAGTACHDIPFSLDLVPSMFLPGAGLGGNGILSRSPRPWWPLEKPDYMSAPVFPQPPVTLQDSPLLVQDASPSLHRTCIPFSSLPPNAHLHLLGSLERSSARPPPATVYGKSRLHLRKCSKPHLGFASASGDHGRLRPGCCPELLRVSKFNIRAFSDRPGTSSSCSLRRRPLWASRWLCSGSRWGAAPRTMARARPRSQPLLCLSLFLPRLTSVTTLTDVTADSARSFEGLGVGGGRGCEVIIGPDGGVFSRPSNPPSSYFWGFPEPLGPLRGKQPSGGGVGSSFGPAVTDGDSPLTETTGHVPSFLLGCSLGFRLVDGVPHHGYGSSLSRSGQPQVWRHHRF